MAKLLALSCFESIRSYIESLWHESRDAALGFHRIHVNVAAVCV